MINLDRALRRQPLTFLFQLHLVLLDVFVLMCASQTVDVMVDADCLSQWTNWQPWTICHNGDRTKLRHCVNCQNQSSTLCLGIDRVTRECADQLFKITRSGLNVNSSTDRDESEDEDEETSFESMMDHSNTSDVFNSSQSKG